MNLGLDEGELGRLTLGELAALNKVYAAREKRLDWRAAVIVCAIANVHRGKDDKALHPEDVMPWLKEKESAEQPGRQTPEQMRAVLEEVTLAMGGVVHPRHRPLADV